MLSGHVGNPLIPEKKDWERVFYLANQLHNLLRLTCSESLPTGFHPRATATVRRKKQSLQTSKAGHQSVHAPGRPMECASANTHPRTASSEILGLALV